MFKNIAEAQQLSATCKEADSIKAIEDQTSTASIKLFF